MAFNFLKKFLKKIKVVKSYDRGATAYHGTRLVLKKTGTRYDLISPVSRFRSH